MKPLLTTNQVAERLQIDVDTVLLHIKSGRLVASNVGNGCKRPRWRISEEDLELFIALTRNSPPQPQRRKRDQGKTTKYF